MKQETGVLPDRLDIQPEDSELMAEIHLLATLILACATTSANLDDDTIDAALGLSPATPATPDMGVQGR